MQRLNGIVPPPLGAMPRIDRDFTVYDYIPGQPIPALIKDPKTGKVYANPLKQWVKPFVLTTEPDSIVLAGNAISSVIPMAVDGKGHMEIFEAFFQSSQPDGYTVTLFDADMRPVLMNREIHVATFASGGGVITNTETFAAGAQSSGGRFYMWPDSHFMNVEKGGRALFAIFRNLSANSNTIRFHLGGRRWYYVQSPTPVADRMQEIFRTRLRTMVYFYTTDKFVQLAGSANGQFSMRMGDDAWSEVVKLTAFSTGRDMNSTKNDFDVSIFETMTGKQLMGSKEKNPAAITRITRDVVFGSGEFPFLLWETCLWEPNMRLTVDLKDNTGATNTIWLTFAARKLFPDPKEDVLARTVL